MNDKTSDKWDVVKWCDNIIRIMLTSAFRALVKNLVKESFYGKKKTINILTTFFISHKSDVKTFFN